MVEYSPPPADLSQLNPIQRHMQKGSLDRQDYAYLLILVLAYVAFRPAIKRGAAWLLAPKDFEEGQQAQKDFAEGRAKATIGANAIRGGKDETDELVRSGEADATASGVDPQSKGQLQNRKMKGQDPNKSEVDKLLDWDDEPVSVKQEGDKSDVLTWLDKWTK